MAQRQWFAHGIGVDEAGNRQFFVHGLNVEEVVGGDIEVNHTLVLSHSVVLGGSISPTVPQTITFTQLARGFNGTQKRTSTITFSHTVSDANTYNRSLANTLSFIQTNAVHKINLANNTITFTHDAQVQKTIGMFQTISFSQTATHKYTPHNDIILQNFGVTNSVDVDAVRPITKSNTLTFLGTATALRVRNFSTSSTFVMSHNAANVKILRPSNSLALTGTATVVAVKNRSIANSLTLANSVNRNIVATRSLISTLVFPPYGTKNGVQVPNAQVTIPKNYVKFKYSSQIILLPSPELGDTEELTNELNLKRTETGLTYTYVKRNLDRKLKYEFHMDRAKAYELRSYVDLTAGKKITLENWKGEIWQGYILNNPFELITHVRGGACGERFIVHVEFDGVRIH